MDEDEEEYGCEWCRNDMPLSENSCCPKCDAWYPPEEGDNGKNLEGWQPIETAPKDGTEMLGFREDCGILLMRWISPADFLTDRELESVDEEAAYGEDWFYADFIAGGRMEGDESPSHWMPLPSPPTTEKEGQ